ncbi:hypothetical protein CC80DRAFT_493865 [Byssothecium circinans]|uniref:CENP-V/GFA domain-containing protein n=1 Tax=Byssothecium circinans TaxID=147558 RepID=A0A6A5TQ69_9PLEO|nr:hypothetical protein CC80DRAFT_493865 [Byssothecium circinans]
MADTKVYDGVCHCGNVKYRIRLALPPQMDSDPGTKAKVTRIYKCNCTTCLKLNMFHTRPAEPENDFIVTSPSTIEELGIYNAFGGKNNWYFCKNCGVQCFGIGAEWVQEELDVNKWAGKEGGAEKFQKVWKTKALDILGPDGNPVHYVSANAVTIEGVDLIEWHDKKWVYYVNNRHGEKGSSRESARYGEPHAGGCY